MAAIMMDTSGRLESSLMKLGRVSLTKRFGLRRSHGGLAGDDFTFAAIAGAG
jgi:hypothetical protein